MNQQQQQQQHQSLKPTSSSNKTEHRPISLIRQRHNRSRNQSPTTSTKPPNAHNHVSIISLAKLKSYMPQDRTAAQFFQCSSPSLQQQPATTGPVFGSAAANIGYYRGNFLDQTYPSSCKLAEKNNYSNNGDYNEKWARVKSLSLSSHANNRTVKEIINPLTPQGLSGIQQTLANQVVAETQEGPQQQQQKQPPRSDSITDSRRMNCIASVNRSSKGVESEGAERTASEVRDHQLLAVREERKRRKIDIRDRGKTANAEGGNNISCDDQREVEAQGGSYTRNNMTPSSLLLLQNHNYIEQHQQQRSIVAQYNDSNHTQREQGDDSLGIGRARTSVANNCSDRGSSGTTAKQSEDQNPPQAHCDDPAFSSSSLMLTNINQFKTSDNIGNSSIINSANTQTSTLSSANIVENSDYSTSQGLNQIHNQLTEADVLASNSTSNNLQQSYHQGLATCDFKAVASGTTGGAQFAHYNTQDSRASNPNNYHENFQAAQMLEQQMKLENAVNNRNIFEGNTPMVAVDHSLQGTGNANIEPLDVARDLARQQARNSINQYYNNHYNFMPTVSSKSTSPTSSTSTPSPKTNAMHQTTSQRPNQLALGNSNSAPQIHLDHLNHHYMGNNTTVSGLNHQQHHANQQYSYNQTAISGTNQHHITMPAHDQCYQQQPHQQQHHQVQPQQAQQLQQQSQQHNQQQQQHQHHSIANQQSIYHHLANNATNVNVNHIYCNTGNSNHYRGHTQSSANVHQQNHLMSGAHQNHLAAQAAAAVVSQTLKTVVNQQSQQHHYGSSISNGFGPSTGSLMNMTAQHHQQFHAVNQLNHHHLASQTQITQHSHQQQQNLPVDHTTSIVSRKYQCKMCPQVFMSKAELKYHNQNHMREAKPYKCLQCPKAFANSSYLSQHMRIHQGVKPYTCDICSRKFTQLSHLQQHKRTHTGDKPYKCNYMNCTKQFSQLSNLQSHSRCHQLDKPYKCNSCYKCFHDEQSLLEHIPRHLESKHLKKNLCIFCGASYQQERGLVKHFQQYHTDKTPTLVAAAIAAGTTGNTSLVASLVSSSPANAFATPSSGGGSSSSSSSSSVSSSGSLNVHNNNINVAHGTSAAFGTNQY